MFLKNFILFFKDFSAPKNFFQSYFLCFGYKIESDCYLCKKRNYSIYLDYEYKIYNSIFIEYNKFVKILTDKKSFILDYIIKIIVHIHYLKIILTYFLDQHIKIKAIIFDENR